jgi:hypothetical protein
MTMALEIRKDRTQGARVSHLAEARQRPAGLAVSASRSPTSSQRSSLAKTLRFALICRT